jgi:L-threonylcarbamoyladenylate synthase
MRFGGPLAAPSANRFGRISPTTAAHVMEELSGRIPLILDGGPCPHGIESTIVRPSGDALELLRPGPVSRETLAQFAPVCDAPRADDAAPQSPGRLASHYAPQTPLRFLSKNETPLPVPGLRCGLLAWDATGDGFAAVEHLSARLDPVEAAARLFSALRGLDTAGLDLILAQQVPMDGVGRAINDRLLRAAATSRVSHE